MLHFKPVEVFVAPSDLCSEDPDPVRILLGHPSNSTTYGGVSHLIALVHDVDHRTVATEPAGHRLATVAAGGALKPPAT